MVFMSPLDSQLNTVHLKKNKMLFFYWIVVFYVFFIHILKQPYAKLSFLDQTNVAPLTGTW